MFIVQAQRLNSIGVLWIKSWAQGPHMHFEMNTIGFPDLVPAFAGVLVGGFCFRVELHGEPFIG